MKMGEEKFWPPDRKSVHIKINVNDFNGVFVEYSILYFVNWVISIDSTVIPSIKYCTDQTDEGDSKIIAFNWTQIES